MNQPSDDSARDESFLSDLAYEFTQRIRHGERPSIDEYARRYPDLASDIRVVFPTLLLMELPLADGGKTSSGLDASWKLDRQRLGDYRLVREVGRGGMGVVYEAIQESLSRRVALKVLPSRVGDTQQMERFLREARATAHLHHTNIVPVYDVGEANGVHFYAMQFIDGQPLSDLLDEQQRASARFTQEVARWQAAQLSTVASLAEEAGPATGAIGTLTQFDTAPGGQRSRRRMDSSHDREPPGGSITSCSRAAHYSQVARLGKQVADALAYAHGEGVLHRDIKPANLLLDSHGTVWITDFGLAQIEGQDKLTCPGDVVGTLRYLPPERFDGHVDERGDIYSLGVTLYELLTSRPAFAASTRARLIDQILNSAPAAPRRIDRRIPRDLETVVIKAMAREPSHRYATAAALADDLERFISGRPVMARRSSAWVHTWHWCRRNKLLAAMTALAAALFVAVLVISVVDSIRVRDQLSQTRMARREARERLFDSLVSQAHVRWNARPPQGRRFETLAVVREAAVLARELQLPAGALARLRSEAIAALCLPDVEDAQTVEAFPVGTAAVDFDPRLDRYARGAIDGSVTIHRVADNHVVHRLPNPGPDAELAVWDGVVFSPDGTYLQQRCHTRHGGCLRLWNVNGSEPRLSFEIIGKTLWLTAFTPDGRHLGVVIQRDPPAGTGPTNATTQAHILDLASGHDAAPPLPADENSLLVFHPTEAQLAISDASGVRIVQWDTGAELSRWNRPHTQPMAWSRDGRQLLARSIDQTDPKIYRWDVERQHELPALTDGTASRHPDNIVFSFRGDRFVRASQSRLQLWEFPSARLLWDARSSALPGIRFSRDDQLLASFLSIPDVQILRVADGTELRRVPLSSSRLGSEIHRAVVTRDGRLLAAPSEAGSHLLDLQTYEELAVIPGRRMPLVFEADGSLLTHADPPEGVVRWPIRIDAEATRGVTIGPPQSLTEIQEDEATTPSLFMGLGHWTASADGRVIATPWQKDSTGAGANIFVADRGDRTKYRRVELGTQHEVWSTSVSPDGKYVATGSDSWWAKRDVATDSVTVWDATTGRRVKDLLIGEGIPQFSPDGKWIAVGSSSFSEGVRLWQVDSWQPVVTRAEESHRSNDYVTFDPRSRLLAVASRPIRLLIPQTGREVATLAHPDQDELALSCFTPDGTRLIGFGMHKDQWSVWVWDIRRIRQQLAHMGLDWDDSPGH